MAVQAQHPSNLFFFNRNVQEGQDFSMQPQQGDFLDQTHLLFNNGGSNPRKRPRESTMPLMNSHQFSLQPQSPQVIDLSLLHNQHYHQPPPPPPMTTHNIVSTGLRLSSGEDQPHNFNTRRLHQQNRHENQNLVSSSSSWLLSEDFAAQINRQYEEIDQFLNAQADGLRRTLAEKRLRHYSALLRAVEEPLTKKLREKDAEVDRATRHHEELEARAAQLTAEAQAWQAKAMAHEAAAASLQAQLQQAMAAKTTTAVAADEGLLFGGGGSGFEPGTEDAESAYVDPDRVAEKDGDGGADAVWASETLPGILPVSFGLPVLSQTERFKR